MSSDTSSPTSPDRRVLTIRDIREWNSNPAKVVTLRDWYITHFCNEDAVNMLMKIQNSLPRYQTLLTKYFEFLSFFGEPPFYTFFIPVAFWVGLTHEASFFCFMMSVTLWFINNLKDILACPRPPCPPLRRAGKEAHGAEYGAPSSHTGLGLMCTYHICLMSAKLFPHWSTWIWLGGLSFVLQTAYSRMYLGLHWLGDLLMGFAVFFFSWLLQEALLRNLVDAILNASIVPWYLFVISHVMNIVNVTPSDPCPCYEDTVRFFGAAAGSVFGGWWGIRHPLVMARESLSPAEQAARLFTLRTGTECVIGVIVIAVCKTLVGVIGPKLLKPLYIFLSGAHADRMPRALLSAYLALCTAVGICFGKRIYPRGLPFPESESTTSTAACVECGDAASVASSSSPIPSSSDETAPATPVKPGGFGRGQLWSLRTHGFWWQWDIHTKSLSYIMVGFSATAIAPRVIVALIGMPE